MNLPSLLAAAVAQGASDLHLKAGSLPMMRVRGDLLAVADTAPLTAADLATVSATVMSAVHQQRLAEAHEVDIAYTLGGLGRFRCNIFQQRGTAGVVFRVIPSRIPTVAELGLPAIVETIAAEPRGLVLVTGATGSGKSTTLAALVDQINRTRAAHIITIEDPIEFLHTDRRSMISQREVTLDTRSFGDALRSSLRQDPDVIMVGEMRDEETVETCLRAAETGHLVCSTLHTLDAAETINRIVTVFPPHQHKQIRLQLASVLKAVVSQRLLPRKDGHGRVPAVEVLVTTPFIRDCIANADKTDLIHDAVAGGTSQYGMQTFDQSILALYEQGLVSYEEALRWASNADEFKLKVQGIGTTFQTSRDTMARGVVGRQPDVIRFGR